MKSSGFIAILILMLLLASCGEETAELSEVEGSTVEGGLKEAADEADTAEIDASVDGGKEDEDDESEEDAGDDDGDALGFGENRPDEIATLAHELENRRRSLDLREREIIRREQLISNLESATVNQAESLRRLKGDIETLIAKMGEDYKVEREQYEKKQAVDEAARVKEDAKQEADRVKRVEELKAAADQMKDDRDRRIAHLMATLKGMRASSGAAMLASMEEDDAVAILRQLGARQAAGMLGGMPAGKAAKLAEAMLGPRPLAPGVLPDTKPTEPGNEDLAKEDEE